MSDLSMIAHDYELNAEFARRFNGAVLNLKRVYLLHRGTMSDSEIQQSRTELRQLLTSLILALQDEGKAWTADQAQVPADVLEHLRRHLKGELPETVLELRRVVETLSTHARLDEGAFFALDGFVRRLTRLRPLRFDAYAAFNAELAAEFAN